jgi:hypothetical protein
MGTDRAELRRAASLGPISSALDIQRSTLHFIISTVDADGLSPPDK